MNRKTFRLWWGWNPKKIEDYLEKEADNGWQLVSTAAAMTFFNFSSDHPRKVRYSMDYNNKADAEYLSLAEDAGWELQAKSAGWLMWKKEYENERPDFFTDNQSFIDRNNRLLRLLSAIVVLLIIIPAMNFIGRDSSGHYLTSGRIIWLYLPSIILLSVGAVKLFFANRKLRQDGRR